MYDVACVLDVCIMCVVVCSDCPTCHAYSCLGVAAYTNPPPPAPSAAHSIPAPSQEVLAKWGDKKMAFSSRTGVSDVAYRGGRGKNTDDMRIMNTAEQVMTLQRVLGALSPHQVRVLCAMCYVPCAMCCVMCNV